MNASAKNLHLVATNHGPLQRLETDLGASVDIDMLMQLFAAHCWKCIPHAGIELFDLRGNITRSFGECAEYSILCPIVIEGEDLGTIRLTRAREFTSEEELLLEMFVGYLRYPLRNAYRHQSELSDRPRDSQSSVSDRDALDLVLNREIELATLHNTPLSLVLLSVEEMPLKANRSDQFVAGRTLERVGECLTDCVRKKDAVFHCADEELVVLLVDTPVEGAAFTVRRMIRAVKKLAEMPIRCGIAGFEKGEDSCRLLQKARDALNGSTLCMNGRMTTVEAMDDLKSQAHVAP